MNLDSGKMASTFLTFCGFVSRFGLMALTASLSSVQTEFSLRSLISSVMGSELSWPQMVPEEQLEVVGVVKTFVETGVVDSEFVAEVVPEEVAVDPPDVAVVPVEVVVEQSVIPLHLL